jgi:hypothetical protein
MTEPQPPQGDFPQVHPSGTEQTAFTRPDFLLNLPNFIAQFIEKIVGLVVQAIVGIFIPGGAGSAFAQLQNWATALLPAQILQPLQDLVDALITLLGHIPIIGPVITQLADIFGFLSDNTTVAQDSANNANAEIAALKAGIDAGTSGALITDTFDGAANTSANGLGANWDQTYDSGSGTYGRDGAGAAHWTNAGTNSQTCLARYSALALNTNYQIARFVLATAMPNYFVNPEMSLLLRMNSAKTAYVEGRIFNGSCEIGYVVGGSYTRFGATVGITSSNGDLWELRAGTGTTADLPYTFVLLQNGVTVCTRTDTGHVSQLGGSYLFSGMRVKAGAQVVGFASAQKGPSNNAVFTATDYVP